MLIDEAAMAPREAVRTVRRGRTRAAGCRSRKTLWSCCLRAPNGARPRLRITTTNYLTIGIGPCSIWRIRLIGLPPPPAWYRLMQGANEWGQGGLVRPIRAWAVQELARPAQRLWLSEQDQFGTHAR
jgi:hypothetical protein